MTAWIQLADPQIPSSANFEKASIGFRQNLHDVRRFVSSADLREVILCGEDDVVFGGAGIIRYVLKNFFNLELDPWTFPSVFQDL